MNALMPVDAGRRERQLVVDPIPVLDTGHFEQMQRVATVMARSPLVPDSLRCETVGTGQNREVIALPFEVALANCFLVVNQAVRWGLDPFAVAQCCSVVHGRLMYEGKLVAAVLDAKLGVQLAFAWNDKSGDAFAIRVTGPDDKAGNARVIEGTVGDWKTTGNNSPWGKASSHRKMLAYRGTREWVRLYAPAILLGVYTADEMEDMQESARETRAAPTRMIPDGPPRRVPTGSLPAHRRVMESKPQETASADEEAEAVVTQYEEDVQHAQSEQDIEDCAALVASLDESDRLSRAQRTRVENATEAVRTRIAAKGQGKGGQPEEKRQPAKPEPPRINTKSKDYARGFEDAMRDVKKCLNQEIKADPDRLRHWEAGHAAGEAEKAKPDTSDEGDS